jgi:hypothetical protein
MKTMIAMPTQPMLCSGFPSRSAVWAARSALCCKPNRSLDDPVIAYSPADSTSFMCIHLPDNYEARKLPVTLSSPKSFRLEN